MDVIRIVDITDEVTFGQIPPCADPGFDHRSCDYWEDADRGSKAARLDWLQPATTPAPPRRSALADNPFAPPSSDEPFNPFARSAAGSGPIANPFASGDEDALAIENPC